MELIVLINLLLLLGPFWSKRNIFRKRRCDRFENRLWSWIWNRRFWGRMRTRWAKLRGYCRFDRMRINWRSYLSTWWSVYCMKVLRVNWRLWTRSGHIKNMDISSSRCSRRNWRLLIFINCWWFFSWYSFVMFRKYARRLSLLILFMRSIGK